MRGGLGRQRCYHRGGCLACCSAACTAAARVTAPAWPRSHHAVMPEPGSTCYCVTLLRPASHTSASASHTPAPCLSHHPAPQVYLASASPPVRYPNVYGVDMPTRSEFVAHGLTEDEICKVGAALRCCACCACSRPGSQGAVLHSRCGVRRLRLLGLEAGVTEVPARLLTMAQALPRLSLSTRCWALTVCSASTFEDLPPPPLMALTPSVLLPCPPRRCWAPTA